MVTGVKFGVCGSIVRRSESNAADDWGWELSSWSASCLKGRVKEEITDGDSEKEQELEDEEKSTPDSKEKVFSLMITWLLIYILPEEWRHR